VGRLRRLRVQTFLDGPLVDLAERWDACRTPAEAGKLSAELERAGFHAAEELRRVDRDVAGLYRRLFGEVSAPH
jgi:hypothetical protein